MGCARFGPADAEEEVPVSTQLAQSMCQLWNYIRTNKSFSPTDGERDRSEPMAQCQ